MKLTLDQITTIARGVARVKEADGRICFCRYTKEQNEYYREKGTDWHKKSYATAGVILEFDTDSEHLGLKVKISIGSSRRFFVHSIFANGQRVGELAGRLEEGESEKLCQGSYFLGEGYKRVKIVFPWSVVSQVCALTIDDGAIIAPVKKTKKVLLYGDSITQGYDSSRPENSYVSQLVQMLDVDGIDKGMGAEVFSPELAELKDKFEPHLIFVAYGTNDWSKKSREEFEVNSRGFFQALRRNYPNTTIIALAPVGRVNRDVVKPFGAFEYIAKYFCELAEEIDRMIVIDCIDFIPCSQDYYSDHVHPNDKGFEAYARNLYAELTRRELD
ncbi:MAG: SGNH/GDSL hydrolase family protein [Lachnospiraceae bacterium]|nr:SGNH/GDSL hydrolase family protein [Lachnospiraceae bacterium]